MMTPEDKQFLEDNRHHHDTWMKAQVIQNLDMGVKQRMQDIINKYWIGGYQAVLWCNDCVVEMLKTCYREYDKWLVEQDKNFLDERTVAMTFPKHDKI
jgi:hypothetical protein